MKRNVTSSACCFLRDKSKDMQVLMGSLSLDKTDPSAQTLPVENAIVHQRYRETPGAVYNDIGKNANLTHAAIDHKKVWILFYIIKLKLGGKTSITKVSTIISLMNFRRWNDVYLFNIWPGFIFSFKALLRLRGTRGLCANETQFVKTACLPDAQLPDGMECTISGWGATEECKSMLMNPVLSTPEMRSNQEL